MKSFPFVLIGLGLAVVSNACTQPSSSSMDNGTKAVPGNQVRFDLDGDLHQQETYYNFPWPSDLRLDANGHPDLTGFLNYGDQATVEGLRLAATQRRGFSTLPVGYFRFESDLMAQDPNANLPADATASVLLVDIDPDSPARGTLYSVRAATPYTDDYVEPGTLAVAATPGIILRPETTYAFVVMRSAMDAGAQPLGVPLSLEQLKQGQTPTGARGAAAAALYAPLWPALEMAGVAVSEVAAATVFTTGDVVKDTADMFDRMLPLHNAVIGPLTVDPDDGAAHDRFCELVGQVTYPQFQQGTQPYNTEGLFEMGVDGLPVAQGTMMVPVTITLPKAPMPVGGYPLVLYFHGSGGSSQDLVDKGPQEYPDGPFTKGTGPAHNLSPIGVAAATSAMPVNPERLPGASDYEYLNLANPKSFRDTFRQGMIEQRLFLKALLALEIDPQVVAPCTGLSLPTGETRYRFNGNQVMGSGNSMGGMYTNLVAAVEPSIKAVVPTGAGGLWSYFIFNTTLIPGAEGLLRLYLGTLEPLSYLHPAMQMLELAWEPAEPIAYVPRLGLRPLPGHPARHIYQPVGKDDEYFPTPVYDAMALASGNQQAGEEQWPAMQQVLALDGRAGMLPYPVINNRVSENGSMYTGVVAQYLDDGRVDAHYIYRQRPDVRFQIACFFEAFLKTGVGALVAALPEGTACPAP